MLRKQENRIIDRTEGSSAVVLCFINLDQGRPGSKGQIPSMTDSEIYPSICFRVRPIHQNKMMFNDYVNSLFDYNMLILQYSNNKRESISHQ